MPDPKSSPTVSARERILETARRLFYSQGIRATGVDRIIAESGVAKMSFYRNFPSKQALVVAFLERRHRFWMDWFTSRVRVLTEQAGRPNLAVMADALGEWFAEPDFRGCAFINTVTESAEVDGETYRIARAHKEELCAFIAGLIPPAAQTQAQRFARLALLIIDGAIVRAQMTGDPGVALDAKSLLTLLDKEMLVSMEVDSGCGR